MSTEVDKPDAAPDTVDVGQESVTPPDLASEVQKWKELSRKHEDRAKSNAKAASEFEAFKISQLTETEKAIREAEDKGRTSALADFGKKLAAAELKAALTGLVSDPTDFIADLDLSKFVGDSGDVDLSAVDAFKTRFTGMIPKSSPPDLGQGRRGTGNVSQLTHSDLAQMGPEQIVQAKKEGRLRSLLGHAT